MREEAPRRSSEKRVLVLPLGKERRRERQRLGFVPPFISWTPVGTSCVQRIEDDVAALACVELRCVFERRIVHDGGFTARLDLAQHLTDECRFPGAGISDD